MLKRNILLLLIVFVCCTFIGCNTDQPKNPTGTNSTEGNGTESSDTSEQMNTSTEAQPTESTYTVNNFENATISDISISGTTATLTFTYTGENQLHLGKWFVLEIYKDGTWYTLPYDIENNWELEAYLVEPNQSKSLDYNWEYWYEPLSAGEYRIVTKVTDFKKSTFSNILDEYYLAKEFTIE